MDTNNSIDRGLFLRLFSSLVEDVARATYANIVTDHRKMEPHLMSVSDPTSEVTRDLTEVRTRCTNEGFSFLTKTLPKLGKALDRALQGSEPFACPLEFRKEHERQTPEFLRWYWRMVFTEDGQLKGHGDPDLQRYDLGESMEARWCVTALRQILYYLYKLETPVEEEVASESLRSFEQVDGELSEFRIIPHSSYVEKTSDLIGTIFQMFNERDILPRHGPGAVATGEKNHEKHDFSRIYTAIERVYPFTDYYEYSLAAVCDNYHRYGDLEEIESGTTKVILVPKDSRGPRIISCEPLEYQWIQQGLGRAIMAHLERNRLTAGHVNFTDQSINRALALSGSADQQWVTLDMKEASDRVGVDLVRNLFRARPSLLDALLATRSPSAELPNGRTVQLEKFATMGSCLCFPVQSVVFFALAVCAIRMQYGISRRKALDAVYVFGDDIIVDARYYRALLQYMPTVGLKFNEAKCCTEGFFRESCGCDAFRGVDVTPLRMKAVWYHRRVNANTIEAYVGHSNMAYARGYQRVAAFTRQLVETQLGPLPEIPMGWGDRAYLAFRRHVSAFQPEGNRIRYNDKLHRMEVRGWTSRAPKIKVPSDAWSMILRRLTSPSDVHAPGVFAVSRGNCLHRGWTSL